MKDFLIGKTLVEYIEAKVEKKFEEKKDILATKLDIEELRTEMQKMKVLSTILCKFDKGANWAAP
ncbi:MAG: hypothetical protein QMD07_04210, partial [Thermodesulfovibrionales bacterium]|nr:hypothetical protein [Thermodesulfovibrionales bacterium]